MPALFNTDRRKDLPEGSTVYLCEGAPDVMILEQEGFPAFGIVGSRSRIHSGLFNLFARELLTGIRERTWEIVDRWIAYQGRVAEETEGDTNISVFLLDALV